MTFKNFNSSLFGNLNFSNGSIIFLFVMLMIALAGCTSPEAKTKKKTKTDVKDVPTLEQMIGQMLMVGFRGLEPEDVSDAIKTQVRNGNMGGIIFFDYDVINKEAVRNIKSPDQVKRLIKSIRDIAPQPLLIAIDQEGGRVNRLKTKYGFPASVSNQYLGSIDNLDSTAHYAAINAKNLSDLGFNLNFAPVVDLNVNPENPVIGGIERSYGANVETVVKHANEWIKAHKAEGIISTLKHFPGHGSSQADSHKGFTDVTRSWTKEELLPFKQVLASGQNTAVMTAHVFNAKLDSIYPATLSPNVIDKILRQEWKHEGLVFSDDLWMKAVNELYDFETILKQSIKAGVDILVYGNNLEYDEMVAEKAIAAISKFVRSGEISEKRIRQSYDRIMKAKANLN